LLYVVVNRLELSMPPTLKLEQAIGFDLWALKAVVNGRNDEVVHLATSNILL
jgi:pyruvate dehydrogenase (quinone)